VYVVAVCRLGESPHECLARLETDEETETARERLIGEAVERAREIEGTGVRVSVQTRLEFPLDLEPPVSWQTVYQSPPKAA
jgi:hypothetical protein